jgi:hypothetical protein
MKVKYKYLDQIVVRMRMGGKTTGSFNNIIIGNMEASRSMRCNGFGGGILFIALKIIQRIPQFWSRP